MTSQRTQPVSQAAKQAAKQAVSQSAAGGLRKSRMNKSVKAGAAQAKLKNGNANGSGLNGGDTQGERLARIEEHVQHLAPAIEVEKLRAGTEQLRAEMHTELGKMDAKMDAKFEKMDAKIEIVFRDMKLWMVGGIVTMSLAIFSIMKLLGS